MTGAAAPWRVRAGAWRLLADLHLHGLRDELLPVMRELPGPGELLPDRFEPDEAAAEHHRLFGMEVFPFASVFLERDAVLGGAVSASVERFFARAGLDHATSGDAPDQLGNELRLLAALTEREDRGGAAELLGGHLLWWLPVFVHSAGRHASPFWRAVLDLTLEAALDQVAEVLPPGAAASAEPPGALALPVEDALEGNETGLRAVARHLATPSRGGMFLAMADLRRLGRGRELPSGFGSREQVLTNLLRSAVGYGEIDGLTADLLAVIEGQEAFLGGVPAPFGGPWLERLSGTRSALRRLAAADV